MKTAFLNIDSVTFPDGRFYSEDDWKTWQPSVTSILEVYPKGFGFQQWLKDVGNNASEIADRAAAVGSKIHSLTEDLNNGKEVVYDHSFDLIEWQMLCKFVDFWTNVQPELIANELTMISSDLGFAGTLDRVLKINGLNYLVDIKTSNYLHDTHELQLSAYAKLWNELHPELQIDKTAILWLKASTRTEKIDHEKEIYQGKGWQLKIFDDYEGAFKDFQHVQAIWKRCNPNPQPMNLVYPMTLKIDTSKK